jgi:hypothetical protein
VGLFFFERSGGGTPTVDFYYYWKITVHKNTTSKLHKEDLIKAASAEAS